MTTSLPTPLVLKEGRALVPIWFAAVITIVAAAQTGMHLGGLFAFVVGAAALGACSIGHEYAHRTLTPLLAQPLSRSRLLLAKLVVLAPLLLLLGLVAAFLLLRAEGIDRVLGEGVTGSRWQLAIGILTPMLGLCIAPWLTLMCRSTLAGVVFTLAVPASLWIAAQIARAATAGFEIEPLAYGPGFTLMIVGMIAVTVVAIVHGRQLFIGLEALDAPRDLVPATVRGSIRADTPDVDSTAHARRRRRSHPLTVLVYKEVRLQALAFAVASLYALGWIAMRLTRTDLYIAGQSFEAISGLYGAFVALLLGAMSSADERAQGTSQWQILQPYAFWKQWTVKVLTVSALALLLGLAVPILLEGAFPLIAGAGPVGPRRFFPFLPDVVSRGPGAILLITIFSMYVSSLSAGGLRALLMALPFVFSLTWLFFSLAYATYRVEQQILARLYGASPSWPFWWKGVATASASDFRTADVAWRWISTTVVAGFVALLLVFAFRNSRLTERGMTMARQQGLWVIASVVLASVTIPGIPAFLRWWLLTH